MRDVWAGPDVELVVEPTAALTVENATRTLPLLRERGIERAVVVCAPLHSVRARVLFSRVYGESGVDCRIRVARTLPHPRAFVWELVALPMLRRHLRAARSDPAARGTP
jgi:uncharacterized SAM-binding protein YcdF (DUF218 family)